MNRFVVLLALCCYCAPVLYPQDAVAKIPEGFIQAYNNLSDEQFADYVRTHARELNVEMIYGIVSEGIVNNRRVYLAFAWSIVKELDNGALRGMVAYFYGRNLAGSGDQKGALAFYARAVAEYLEVNYQEGAAMAYDGIGDAMLLKSDARKAKIAYSAGLNLLRAAPSPSAEIELHLGLAVAWFRLNNGAACKSALDSAARLLQLPKMEKYSGDYAYVAGMYWNYAGNQRNAARFFNDAMAYYQKEQDTMALVNVWQGLGDMAAQLGADSTAGYYYAKVFSSQRGQPLIKLEARKGLGVLKMQQEDFIAAASLFRQGLAESLPLGDKLSTGNFLRRLADLEALNHNYRMADSLYSAALSSFRDGVIPAGEGNCLLSLAELSLKQNNPDMAASYAGQALAIFKKTGLEQSIAFAEFWLAKAAAAAGKPDAATGYRNALTRFSQLHANAGLENDKVEYGVKLSSLYRQAAEYLLITGDTAAAFKAVEGMRARVLFEKFAATGALNALSGLPKEYRQALDSLNGKKNELAAALSALPQGHEYDSVLVLLQSAAAGLTTVEDEIALKFPAYASLRYPQLPELKEIQENLRHDEVILEYCFAETGVWLIVIRKSGASVRKLVASASVISMKISSYIKSLRNTAARVTDPSLFQLLVPEGTLAGVAHVIVVPDGPLYGLPFEALWAGRKYLVEEVVISNIQSSSLWHFLRTHPSEVAGEGFVGFGDPVYDTQSFSSGQSERGVLPLADSGFTGSLRREMILRSIGSLQRLPGTAIEVTTAGGLFTGKGLRADVYLREQASEANFKAAAAARYAYYLLSCHGIAADRVQGLVISQLPASGEDGFLSLDEILNLAWAPRLVVLSACQTGKGEVKKGEGIYGLTRAAMYSGARAVAASLWSVSDDGTNELMQAFFKALVQRNKPPADALREAKIALLRMQKFSHPYFWSPFVLYGE